MFGGEEWIIVIDASSKAIYEHLSLLEEAMLIELEDGGYKTTPRCVAYLYEKWGYEWRR